MKAAHHDEGAERDDPRQRAREVFRQVADYHGSLQAPAPDADILPELERAVLQLPRRTREIFLAHRIDGHCYAEIAEITGLSVKRVQRHMAKALFRISRSLDGDGRTPWQRWRARHHCRWFR